VTWLGTLILLRYLFKTDLANRPRNIKAVMKLDPGQSLNEPAKAKKILIVLGVAILMFFVHHLLHIEPAFVALGAAALAMMWVQPDIHEVLKKVEWSVLVFFGALFVMVGGLEHAGVLESVVGVFRGASGIHPVLFGVAIIWIVAILSAIVDNIPITIALIPIIQGLGNSGMNIAPLWWALAFGAGFGGNGTIIGSTANIIVVTLSEKTRTPITAALWMKRGLPVMFTACTIASILYTIFYNSF
jgi:Na+/H+ antiporter NhaD/arsenite permease-like protein